MSPAGPKPGASHEVWSPTALAGRGASWSGGCHPSGRSRFGVSATGPRAVAVRLQWRPPVRFCAGGNAGWGLPVWRTFRSSFWRLKVMNPRCLAPSPNCSEPFVFGDRCSGDHALATTCMDRPTTSAGAGSHLPVRDRVIRRGRFSRATFRTRRIPGSATWPDGRVLPSCRPAALLGLCPSQVCSRPRVDTRTMKSAANH
jgi:hypothetical protein